MPSDKKPTGSQQGFFDFTTPRRAEPMPVAVEPDAPPIELLERQEKLEPKTYHVRDIVRAASRTLEARYGSIWVEGEVSNFSAPRSGHLYFTMKDADAQLPAVMFQREARRLQFQLRDGMQVRARGRLSIYEGQGKFQFYVDALEPAGLGAQQVAFELLKQKLQAEGLFERTRKRPLPRWPRRVGLCTSPTGAAIRDVLHIAARRGRVHFLLSPCQVQGELAPQEIIAALKLLERHADVDVIIVGRGGGSAEDLAAFNDERVARAIAACRVPVVSAVGHEVDFTIADFVADHRAPTPSAAAELVVPLWADAHARLREIDGRLFRAGRRGLGEARQRLDAAQDRALAAARQTLARKRRLLDEHQRKLSALHPRARLESDRRTLHALEQRLQTALRKQLQQKRPQLVALEQRLHARLRQQIDARKRAFATAAGKLDALSPLSVLERGYSLTKNAEGHVLTRASDARPGDEVRVKLARGELDCRVQSVIEDDKDPR
jgi:exodeoxyribonuclease VII large subunit